MIEKNRFSNLLEQLMLTADLKNYTLAQDLQYDVSYISKWVSGRMLPAEKTAEKVLKGISSCIVESSNEKSIQSLLQDYRVYSKEDLEQAIYDNLESEYNYVKGLKKTTGSDIAPKTSYFAELTLPQFISKMRHPILRRVKSLDVVAAMDILSMENEYRLLIAQIEDAHLSIRGDYPDVHFSLMLNLEVGERDYVYDTIFIINMLTNFSHVDFLLYGGMQAYGRIIFAVKDAYSISGMLIDPNHCLSISISEDSETSNTLYHNTKSLFNREMLLFQRSTMQDMLSKYNYIRSILSPNLHWLIGHMTEHLLPDNIFKDLLAQDKHFEKWNIDSSELQRIHSFTNGILEESRIHIMIYESALSDFAFSGELDFFNHKVQLSTEQRLDYIKHILALLKKNDNLELKLIHGKFVTDFQYIVNPCLFLSNEISYLRLHNTSFQKNIVILNGVPIKNMFDKFYEEIWTNRKDVVIENPETVISNLEHTIQTLELMSRTE